MRKLLSVLVCLSSLVNTSLAIEYNTGRPRATILNNGILALAHGKSVLYTHGLNKGLLFYKNFELNPGSSLDAYGMGSGRATFTATRAAATPATYTDSSGTVQLVITSNVPRFNSKTYTTTGLIDAKGWLPEAAGTNRATYSSIPENAAWTKTNVTAEDADAGSSSPDGTATSARIVATTANGTLTQAYVDAVAGVYTASCYIKRKTGTGVINLRANTGDAYTAITTSVLTTTWTRVQVSSTSLTNPTFDLQLVTNTDAVYIYGCQLEKNPCMTSLIPCPTTALTRNTETLTYPIAGNRNASEETIVIKWIPGYSTTSGTTKDLFNSDTKQRRYELFDNIAYFPPNATDSASCETSSGINSFTNNVSQVVALVAQHISPYASIYKDGSVIGTPDTTHDYINPAWGTYFYMGSSATPNNQIDSIIQKIAIFNRALSASEVVAISALMAN